MERRKRIWLVWAVVLLCYLVPYTLLNGISRWYGSFLFWALAGLVIIALNVYITQDFKEHSDD